MTTAPNIVRLPTAAPRKVQQPWNKATRAERERIREATPWPGTCKFPDQEKRNLLDGITRTPELALIMALYCKLPREYREGAIRVVMALAERNPDCEASKGAARVAATMALWQGEER